MKFSDLMGSALLAAAVAGLAPPAAIAQGNPVYRCPGNPVLYTDQLSAKQAQEKGCRTIEGAPITIMQTPKPRTAAAPAASGGNGDAGSRVTNADQRNRDRERRSILESELRSAEARLAELNKEYNSGEPERRGDERNYAKYQARVADLKTDIARKQDDIAALKREISKLPQ